MLVSAELVPENCVFAVDQLESIQTIMIIVTKPPGVCIVERSVTCNMDKERAKQESRRVKQTNAI